MFHMMQEWWDIRKATRSLESTRRSYDKALSRAAKEGKNQDDIGMLESEASYFVQEAYAERQMTISDQLLQRAERLSVVVPDRDMTEMWEELEQPYYKRTLTKRGIAEVRNAIRTEMQAKGLYPKIIFIAITALVGAIAAIISAIAALIAAFK